MVLIKEEEEEEEEEDVGNHVGKEPSAWPLLGFWPAAQCAIAPARSAAPCRTSVVEDQGGALAVRASRPRCRRVALVDSWPPATRDWRRNRAPPSWSAFRHFVEHLVYGNTGKTL
jgi:hypothetical protein